MIPETKQCQNCKNQFVIEPEDFEFYDKIKAVAPKTCPDCRQQKRLAFWPFAKFNKRKCDLSGEKIISIYPSNAHFPVYKSSNWNSDAWELPFLDYDASKNFFEQLYGLQKKSPKPHQFGINNQNCDYCDDVWDSKNCYLCRSLANCENLSYSYRTINCRDSYDLTYCYDSELSYDCSYCFKLYNVKYAFDSRDSFDSAFLYDCRNVRNCFMCWNLRNKEYHILNQPYSKEAYFEKLKEYNLNSWSTVQFLKKNFEKKIKEEAVHKNNFNTKIINSVGNYLSECKNCKNSYFLEKSENCSYYFRGAMNKDIFDSAGVYKGELAYDVNQMTEIYNMKYSNYCTNCRDSEYLDSCMGCENCFGCVGLKNKSYSILNKQYSKEDYYDLIAKIKKTMEADGSYGEFFPNKMAHGGYNLSLSGIFFSKTEEEAKRMGYNWEELEDTDVSKLTISPFIDDISAAGDEIIGKVFMCEETGRPFNLKQEEIEFYKKRSIPLPHHYPDVRTKHRIKNLFCIKPVNIKCVFCQKNIISYYPQEWEYKKIACEECYLREVV